MYNYKKLAWILTVSTLFFACLSNASDKIPNLKGPLELDGELNDAIWNNATKIELSYETSPSENIPAKFQTTAFIFEDGNYLYVGFEAKDLEAKSLRASFRDRDNISDEDLVGIKIDTFNDQRRTYNFFVNPQGIQLDSISDDVLDREDISWNSIWYSAGQITDSGYSVEIKIPFKALRFANNRNVKQWAMDLVRFVPKDFKYRLASNPVDRNINCTICQYKKYQGFQSITTGKNLELIPYLSSNKTETRNPAVSNEWNSESVNSQAGLDLRWAVSDNSILNATINPDFSQVESDAAQLDVNTRFALFFPEKRPFFLESSDYFNTMLTVFYSRNIADPDAGIQYTSKGENGTLGALFTRDNATNIILPSSQSSRLISLNQDSNSAAFRYAHDWSEDTLFGVTMTHRDAGDYSNDLISFDGKHQLTDTDVFRYQLIHTETSNSESMQTSYGLKAKESGNAYRFNYSHNDRDWSWFASHNDFDEGYRADLGFQTRSGYRKTIIGGGHRWYGDESDFFSRIQLRGDWDTSYQDDGQRLETESEFTLSLAGKSQSQIDFHFGERDVFFDQQWFDQNFYDLTVSFKPLNSLRVGGQLAFYDDIDFLSSQARAGEVFRYSVFTDWQATKHLKLLMEYVQQDFDLMDSDYFNQQIFNANFIYQFNDKSFLRLLVRYRDTNFINNPVILNDIGVESINRIMQRQLLYTYKFDAKSVLYLGYSDNGIENDTVLDLTQNKRTIFAKFSYAFQL